MATVISHHNNISIQPLRATCSLSTKIKFVLRNDNITENEIYQKSNSDKTKRRIAHVAKFPVPVIKELIPHVEKQENSKQKKPKQEKPKIVKPKKVQKKLGDQHMKMKKLRNCIATIPWAYSEMYFGKKMSEQRKSDDLEITTMITKKQKTN